MYPMPAVFLVLALLSVPDVPPLALFPPDMFLVRARIVDVVTRKRGQRANLWIEHVYVGGAAAEGQFFTATRYMIISGDPSPSPQEMLPLRKGEVGIWWIIKDLKRRTYKEATDIFKVSRVGGWGPARDDAEHKSKPSYKEGIKWAEAWQRLYTADREGQLRLLKAYALSPDEQMRFGSLSLLLWTNPPELFTCLEELAANPVLSVYQIPRIDDAMCNNENWLRSPIRVKLLTRLVSEKYEKQYAWVMKHGERTWITRCRTEDEGGNPRPSRLACACI